MVPKWQYLSICRSDIPFFASLAYALFLAVLELSHFGRYLLSVCVFNCSVFLIGLGPSTQNFCI